MDNMDKTPEEFANEYFLVTEQKLMAYAKNYPNQPLAYVFYNYLVNHNLADNWSIAKVQNFWNRINIDTGALEVEFSDNSIYVLRDGLIHVIHAKTGYFYTFNNSI